PPRPTLFPYTTLFRSLQVHLVVPHRVQKELNHFLTVVGELHNPVLQFPLNVMEPSGRPHTLQPPHTHRQLHRTRPPINSSSLSLDRKSTRLNSSHVKI